MQLFCARRAENFRKLCNSFARVACKICVIPTLDVCFYSDLNAMLTRSTLSDVVRYAQLTIDECTQFFVRGACRISGNFAIFCKIFAQNLRDLDAGLARYLALERTSTRKRAATKVCGSVQSRWPISCNFSARGVPKIFGNFAILSRELRANFV